MVRRMSNAAVEGFFAALAAANPEPEGELEWSSPFTLLVAVVLSAQATDVGVNKATRKLFAVADTPAALVAPGEPGVREPIQTIGLFHAKAKNAVELTATLRGVDDGEGARARRAS